MKLQEYLLTILIDFSKGDIIEVGVCRDDEWNLVNKYIKKYSSAYEKYIFKTRMEEAIYMIEIMPNRMHIYEKKKDNVKILIQMLYVINFKHPNFIETRFRESINYIDYSDYDLNDY